MSIFLLLSLLMSLLIIGHWIEEKFNIPSGVGPLLTLLSLEVPLTLILLVPFNNQSAWKIESRIIWISILIFALTIYLKKPSGIFVKVPWITTTVLLTAGYYVSYPGERSWDGAGYHNVISLLTNEHGNLWNWPNLMWAQWFPASQEIASSSLLNILKGTDGLIGINLFWVSLLFNFFYNSFPEILSSKSRYIFSLGIIVSFPVLLSQVGTSYVDLQTGIAFLVCILLTTAEKEIRWRSSWIILAAAGLTSTKWSGFALVGVIFSYIVISNYRNLAKILYRGISLLAGSILGIFAIGLRNFLEFKSPTFPFKGPFHAWGGLFEQSVMTSQIGVANLPPDLKNLNLFEAFMYQYIYSPIILLMRILKNLMLGNLDHILAKIDAGNFVNYDSRLGGFGLLILILVTIGLVVIRHEHKRLIASISLLCPLFFFPMSWWPRYYFALPLSFIILEREAIFTFILGNVRIKRCILAFVTVSTLFLAPISIAEHVDARQSWPSELGYGGRTADILGEKCQNIVVIGEGLTFSNSLWGTKLCNKVVASIHFGNSQETLGQFGSLPMPQPNDIAHTLHNLLMRYSKLTVMFIGPNSQSITWQADVTAQIRNEARVSSPVFGTESNGHPFTILRIQK